MDSHGACACACACDSCRHLRHLCVVQSVCECVGEERGTGTGDKFVRSGWKSASVRESDRVRKTEKKEESEKEIGRQGGNKRERQSVQQQEDGEGEND